MLTVEHGGQSGRLLAPIVAELREALAEKAPWTTAPAFTWTVEAWCWAEGRSLLYRRWFDQLGELDDESVPRPGLSWLDRCEKRADAIARQLGLTPATLSTILARLAEREPGAMAGALETMMAAGREIRTAAERRQIAAAPEDGDRDGG